VVYVGDGVAYVGDEDVSRGETERAHIDGPEEIPGTPNLSSRPSI
jgi:hypothetical protein